MLDAFSPDVERLMSLSAIGFFIFPFRRFSSDDTRFSAPPLTRFSRSPLFRDAFRRRFQLLAAASFSSFHAISTPPS